MSDLSPGELIFWPELKSLVPIARTTIWRMERSGKFPHRINIGERRVVWRRSQVEAWLAQRTTAPTPFPVGWPTDQTAPAAA